MIIIIEGINGTGKTFFLKKYIDMGFICMNDMRAKFRYPNIDDIRNRVASEAKNFLYVNLIEKFNLHRDKNLIFDRFHLTEAAYSLAFRKYDDMFPEVDEQFIINVFKKVDDMLFQLGNVSIQLLVANKDVAIQRAIDRGDSKKNVNFIKENYVKLNKNIFKFYDMSKLHKGIIKNE